jgi:DNA transformation protein
LRVRALRWRPTEVRNAGNGSNRVAVSREFLDYLLGQLAPLGHVVSRRMFGGVGLYHEELFFGLIDDDVLYLKADESNRADYTSRAMEPFRPYPDRPIYSMSYYQVPADVLEDAESLAAWARKSCAAALKAKK